EWRTTSRVYASSVQVSAIAICCAAVRTVCQKSVTGEPGSVWVLNEEQCGCKF
ncbi:AAEL001377-PA, partial [Aedes aegypti]